MLKGGCDRNRLSRNDGMAVIFDTGGIIAIGRKRHDISRIAHSLEDEPFGISVIEGLKPHTPFFS